MLLLTVHKYNDIKCQDLTFKQSGFSESECHLRVIICPDLSCETETIRNNVTVVSWLPSPRRSCAEDTALRCSGT